MKAARTWQGFAVLGSTLALVAGAAALPSASVAAATHACGNRTLSLELEAGPGQPKTKLKLPVKQLVTQGVSCTTATKFLTKLFSQGQGPTPEGYSCKAGKFKAPAGTFPQVCTKPGKKISFATRGG